MTAGAPPGAATDRYGPASFVAALVNILLIGLSVWMFIGAYMVLLAPPILLADAAVGYVLARFRGRTGQIGRGILVGCSAVFLSVALGVGIFLVGHALGL